MYDNRGETKEKYKDCSVDELKVAYEDIIKEKFSFSTKEEQMKHDIAKSIYARCHISFNIFSGTFYMYDPNDGTITSVLQELIKEKTGEGYSIESKNFFYDISELIDFVANKSIDPFWNKILKDFFNKLDDEKLCKNILDANFIEHLRKEISDEEKEILVKKQKQLYKIEFLLALANGNNKTLFDDFCKELTTDYDAEAIFNKYNNLVEASQYK